MNNKKDIMKKANDIIDKRQKNQKREYKEKKLMVSIDWNDKINLFFYAEKY